MCNNQIPMFVQLFKHITLYVPLWMPTGTILYVAAIRFMPTLTKSLADFL